jgi:hypothetical protein
VADAPDHKWGAPACSKADDDIISVGVQLVEQSDRRGGIIFGVLYRLSHRSITTGMNGHKPIRVNAKSRRHLGGINRRDSPGRSGTEVKDSPPGSNGLGGVLSGDGNRAFGCVEGSKDRHFLLVHQSNHFLGGHAV